jgi:hypothetical protein
MTTAPDAPQELGAEMKALMKDFELKANKVAMPDAKVASWTEKLTKVPAAEKKARATDLLAMASKFHRSAGAQAQQAIGQLCQMAAVLLGTKKAAKSMFEAAGVDVSGTNHVTGGGRTTAAPAAGEKAPPGSLKAGSLANFHRRG